MNPSSAHSTHFGIPRRNHLLRGVSFALVLYLTQSFGLESVVRAHPQTRRIGNSSQSYSVPLPPLLAKNPPAPSVISSAAQKLDSVLSLQFSALNESGVDSISVAVVTSNGSVYEGFWGVKRANETDAALRGTVDRNSIYRLGSGSKLITALETYILRNRGVLNLFFISSKLSGGHSLTSLFFISVIRDDSVKKYIPQLTYIPEEDPMTFRQLMSHMSGLGRDWPPGNTSNAWPKTLGGAGPLYYNGQPFPTHQDVYDAIAYDPLIAPPYTYPIYSNTGYSLLGITNVAANEAFEGSGSPTTHAELVKRDIFDPLGLNGSSFFLTDVNKPHVVVASVETLEADLDFGDATNPYGGQFSSISDLVKLMQTFLDPTRPESLISPYTVREWMRPMYVWPDNSAVGALWEIFQAQDSYGREQLVYQKSGDLVGYHSAWTINPINSYGVIVLTTGNLSEPVPLTNLVIEQVQSAFDTALESATSDLLVGSWRSDDGQGEITIVIEEWSLFVTNFTLNGTDVLYVMESDGDSTQLPLWSTSVDEYKLAVSSGQNGCEVLWVGLDGYGYIDGYSVNLLRVSRTGNNTTLLLPATGTELKRQ
ncbi:hypothetical protein SERLA73DRAFT_77610 [Serpula lacrymans var. lacrymans S7.3]|uniref:Beta-lactamase-related domain-containing protein n=2 Tax=Serpula lacrymans var. lacrymans TaxID=341189 RepID=F8Q9X2_SERL3|nr:uncharacterized protein SERLADRAFT_442507 [Serpula lacrymans var. lacrymans S7.9]EGN94877.1 hypothetical protein SERLA73DRAFT_77610 [Serpula lacrymans var. lacrymans S7.3]EGO20370.1 hypothetical protein SERLADRAFT_442507 [Serpula lacrymans var. lacrymans S7.9]